jgi:hypothetical protein
MMDGTYLMMRHFVWKQTVLKKTTCNSTNTHTHTHTHNNTHNNTHTSTHNNTHTSTDSQVPILPGDIIDFSKIFPNQYDESKKMFYENNLHRYVKPSKSCLRK